jgi:hypothetical protein
LVLAKYVFGYTFGDFFSSSSGHPGFFAGSLCVACVGGVAVGVALKNESIELWADKELFRSR